MTVSSKYWPDVRLSPADLKHLASLIGVGDFSAEQKTALETALHIHALISPNDTRENDALLRKELKNASKIFRSALDFLDESGTSGSTHRRTALSLIASHSGDKYADGRLGLNAFRDEMRKYACAAEAALDGLGPRKRGRPPDIATELLITSLAAVYDDATGRAPTVYTSEHTDSGYGGQFLKFVLFCLRLSGVGETPSETALGERIKRAMARQR